MWRRDVRGDNTQRVKLIMKIFQSWKRNNPDILGYSITLTITYSSFDQNEIDELEKKLPKGMLVMNLEQENGKNDEN